MTPCDHKTHITESKIFGNEIEITISCEHCETTFTYWIEGTEIFENFDPIDTIYKIVGDYEPYRPNYFNF